jgi:hypothetical protein
MNSANRQRCFDLNKNGMALSNREWILAAGILQC